MKTLKQILSELYSEPEVSTFTHEGNNYNLNGILSDTLGMQQFQVKVSDIKWILRWDPMTKKDSYRIRKADITAPILVTRWKNKLVVLDGIHRLARAIQLHLEHLPAIEVNQYILDKNKL